MSTQLAPIEKQFEDQARDLLSRTQSLVVRDQDSFRNGRILQKDWDGYIENVGLELKPGISKAKGLLEHLQNQYKKWADPAKAQRESLRTRCDEWAAEEKRQSALEQEREQAKIRAEAQRKADAERAIAEAAAAERRKEQLAEAARQLKIREKEIEEARKAGEMSKKAAAMAARMAEDEAILSKKRADEEAAAARKLADEQAAKTVADAPTIAVKPSIPTVAGVKNQTYYYGEVTNSGQLIAAYNAALLSSDLERQRFLGRFIMVNEQEIGKFARDTKDCDKAASLVPGCRFTSKG
jgi:multidrug efflux pump subunit AcrA (membrane-fusion protein)